MRKGLVACYTSVCSRRMKSCAPIRLQNVMIHVFIHPFPDVTFRKMELEAVNDKVTLDIGYESLKAKQKEAIMLFIYKRETYYQQDLEKVCLLHHIAFVLSHVLLYGFPEQTDVQHATRPFLMVWVWLARLITTHLYHLVYISPNESPDS